MIEGCLSCVSVVKDESRTVDGIAHFQALRDSLDQYRLARAELAFERDQVSWRKRAGQPRPKRTRLVLRLGFNGSARNPNP